jgi:hypothetical protein
MVRNGSSQHRPECAEGCTPTDTRAHRRSVDGEGCRQPTDNLKVGSQSGPQPYRFFFDLRCSSTALADVPTAFTAAFNSS